MKVSFDCGILGEVEFEVDYDFQPAERQTYNYPGCEADIQISSVKLIGIDGINSTVGKYLQDDDSFLEQCIMEACRHEWEA